jgi:hypothetical protein
MAKAHEMNHPSRWEPESPRQGRQPLAEIVLIRPEPAAPGPGNPFTRFAQVFASLRAQAAPLDSPPSPPTSPAPLRSLRPHSPDAA